MRNILTYSLFAATIAKVAAVLALGPASIEMDALGYWELSDLVMDGDFLMFGEPIAYRTPCYPWFLATVRTVFGDGSLFAIIGLQGVMAMASVCIAGKIASEVTQSRWAMPLTLLVALPGVSALTYSATILTDVLFTFLLMLNLWSVLIYLRSPTASRVSLVGISLALAMLTRPIVMYLWIAHLVLVLCKVSGGESQGTEETLSMRTRFLHVGIAALVIGLLVSPWLVRNQRLFHSTFLTEFLGRNVWIVTFQDGSGAGLSLPETEEAADLKQRLSESGSADQWRATWSVSRALVDSGFSDPEADRLMKRVSIDAMKSDPGLVAYKAIRRTANYWRCAVTDLPVQGTETGNYQGQLHWSLGLAPVTWAIENRLSRLVWFNTLITSIIAIAVIILIIHPETRPYGIWIALILSYFAAVTGLVEIPNYRYRIVVEPLAAAAVASAMAIIARPTQRPGRQHDASNLTTTHG